jgi:hypothetical protein
MSGNSDLWYLCEAQGITVVVRAIESNPQPCCEAIVTFNLLDD